MWPLKPTPPVLVLPANPIAAGAAAPNPKAGAGVAAAGAAAPNPKAGAGALAAVVLKGFAAGAGAPKAGGAGAGDANLKVFIRWMSSKKGAPVIFLTNIKVCPPTGGGTVV